MATLLVVIGAVKAGADPLTITWSMANGETSTGVTSIDDVASDLSWAYGSDLKLADTPTGTYFNNASTLFTRVGSEKLTNDRSKLNNSYVEFKYTPYAGLTFTPTTISFDIVKVGTGDPNIWVECIQGSTTTSIAANVAIRKSDEETPSEHLSYDLTGIAGITSTTDESAFRIYIGKLANNKQVAIANVEITGTLSGSKKVYTTVYNLATAIANYGNNFEGNSGVLPVTSAEEGSNAPEIQVDATKGKLGANGDWAQLNVGTVLTLPGVPKGATITFNLYNTTALTIDDVAYTNGQTYTAPKDKNVVMACTTGGYIKSITVTGGPFVTVEDDGPYTNTWYFGKSNGAEEFALQKSAEYTYTVNDYPLVINTDAGKLNNASRTDQWGQCNDGTTFKVPVYAGSKLTWGRYNGGSETGFTIDGQLYNEYYIATADGTVSMSAKGISYLSFIKIEPATLYEVTGTVTGGDASVTTIVLTATGNGQPYTADIADGAFTLSVPAGEFTPSLGGDVAFVVGSPTSVNVTAVGSIGTITLEAATSQTVTGQITNAPVEAFTLTFTGANNTETVNCEAGATSYTTTLMPDTYVISSSTGTLSPLSQESFKVLTEAVNFNIYYPEAAVPAATQQEITVDNKATVAANVYRTITDALAAAQAGNISAPVITLTSGQTYREQVIVDMPNVTLKTSGAEKAKITWYYGIGYAYYSLGTDGYYNKDRAMTRNSIKMVDPARWGATFLVRSTGSGFKAENIIFENSFNQYYTAEEVTDGVTPNGVQSITYNRQLTSGQSGYEEADTKAVTERACAIAFENNPTGCQLYNCVFRGSQDTFYSSGKLYVKNCNIIGNTDYIFGGGYVVFDDCNLTIGGYSDQETSAYMTAYKEGGTLDADKCYIFRDCTVKAGDRTHVMANLGRDWGGEGASVYYFNLKNEIGNKLSYKWTNMGGAVSAGTANLHIYDFDPTVNANYSSTGANGANVNGVVSDDDAKTLYTGVVTKLGFTPEKIYDITLDENSVYNTIRIAAANGGTGDVTITRNIAADQWNTLCLPFSMTAAQVTETFGTGTKLATFTNYNATTKELTMVSATDITAGQPCMIWVETAVSEAKTISGVTYSSANPVVTQNGVTFQGTYQSGNIPAGAYFVSANNLYQSTGNSTIKPFRAYFTAPAGARLLFVDEATAISTINNTTRHDVYDLQGRKVNGQWSMVNGQLRKGLYIVDGKKHTIK